MVVVVVAESRQLQPIAASSITLFTRQIFVLLPGSIPRILPSRQLSSHHCLSFSAFLISSPTNSVCPCWRSYMLPKHSAYAPSSPHLLSSTVATLYTVNTAQPLRTSPLPTPPHRSLLRISLTKTYGKFAIPKEKWRWRYRGIETGVRWCSIIWDGVLSLCIYT